MAQKFILEDCYSYLEVGKDHYGFCCGFPTTMDGYDPIWVVVCRLTKSSQFTLFQVKYTVEKLAQL